MRSASISLFGATVLLTGAIFTGSAAEPVRPSPPFSITRIGAAPLKLSQYKGKVVALAFIYTTCPHCQHLTTILNQVAKDYGARGVQVLECAFNDDAVQTMPAFIQQFNPTFPAGFATRASVMSYLQYTITDTRPLYVPHMIFIDRVGIIRGDYPGESPFLQGGPDGSIRQELDQMLKASGPTAPAKK
jgi:thiol-disulfide isomerase/thioredoxin